MRIPRTLLRLLPAIALLSAVSLLGEATAQSKDTGQSTAGLSEPAQDDVSTPEANAVVLINGCTGTLISPTLVLTSAHCFVKRFDGDSPIWSDRRALWQPVEFPDLTANGCCTSGLRGGPAQGNRDLPGWDFSRIVLSRPEPTLCQQRCRADGACEAWTYVRPGVQGANAVCYLKRSDFRVDFGNTRSTPVATAWATDYSMGGFDDIILYRLDRPVPASVAVPEPVLTDIPGDADIGAWLGRQRFAFAGWGGNRPVRQRSDARFGAYPNRPGTISLFRLEGAGGVTIEGGDSGGPGFVVDPECGGRTVRGRHLAGVVQGAEAGGGRFVATFSPGGRDGEGNRKPNLGRWLERALYTEAPISTLDLTIETGGDDLRAGSVPYGTVRLRDGRSSGRVRLKGNEAWGNHSTHTASIRLPSGTRVQDLQALILESDGAPRDVLDSYDNWNVQSVAVGFTPSGACPVTLAEFEGTPYVRLTGSEPSRQIPLIFR